MAKIGGIRRSKSIDKSIVEPLARQAGVVTPFATIRELLCFAAMLGFAMDKRKKIPPGEVEDVARQQFEDNDSDDYIYLIGVAASGSLEILKDGNEEELRTIFEEYAQGGLDIIAAWMSQYNDPKGFQAIVRGLYQNGFIDQETIQPEELLESLQF